MLCWLRKKKLFEYAIGELDTDKAQKLEKHLKSCHRCREYVSFVQKINSMSAGEEKLFFSEVFWRKFDERLDLSIAQAQTTYVDPARRNVKFILKPFPVFALGAAAVCILLVFITFSLNNPFWVSTSALQDEELIETVLLVEDDTELNLNGDEDAYIEEILLQIALSDA